MRFFVAAAGLRTRDRRVAGTAAKQSAHRLSRRRRRARGLFVRRLRGCARAAPFAVSQLTRLSLFMAASTERRPRRPRLDMPPSSEGEGEGEGEGPLDRRGDALRDFAREDAVEGAPRGSAKPTGSRPFCACSPPARRRRPEKRHRRRGGTAAPFSRDMPFPYA